MKSDIFVKLKEAIKTGPGAEIASTSPVSEEARLFPASLDKEKMIKLFMRRAETSGANVYILHDGDSLRDLVSSLLPERCIVSVAKDKLSIGEEDLLPETVTAIPVEELDKDKLFELDAAITGVDLAVAETGSILLCASLEKARIVSLVSLIHIAIVKKEQIVPDLLDLSDFLAKGDFPAGYTLVSGPSKTADIEIKLVIGVHGPAKMHIIILK